MCTFWVIHFGFLGSQNGSPKKYTLTLTCVARAIYYEAAMKGAVIAQYNLGMVLEYGRDTPSNSYLAFCWYKIAATQNYEPAQLSAGTLARQNPEFRKKFGKTSCVLN